MALKSVLVQFDDPKHNYTTSVNGKLDNDKIVAYFENTYFNVAPYPHEQFERCTKARIVQAI